MTSSRFLPATQDVDGVACALYVSPALFRAIPDFEVRQGDIIQLSYPRCGSHWVQQVIQLIVYEGKSAKTFAEFLGRAPFVELLESKSTNCPRLLRSHLPLDAFPFSEKAKYVYVARNPWDCCVSVYHMMRNFPSFEFGHGTFDDCLNSFLDGTCGFGDYFRHVISGYERRNEPNVLFLTYEDLHRDSEGVILTLAHFLGAHHGERLESSRAALEDILEKSSVAFMKDVLKTDSGEVQSLLSKNPAEIQPAWLSNGKDTHLGSAVDFVRNGRSGDWRHYFTPENAEKMQERISERATCRELLDLWKHD